MAVPSQYRVGSYQLISLIRSGHACEIWKVQRADEESRQAMKLLRRGPHCDRQQLNFLKHEYAVAQRLHHSNIVRVYDFGTNAEVGYLVMELYPFLNLKQKIQQGAERLAHQAETIIRTSAEGLQHLHEQGWIHCDVKPDNFLVSDEGNVKLIDFSLAQRPKGRLSRLLSGRAPIQGTKSYMSPEQIRRQPVDARSDVYSLGCVVHELIGGKVPFTGTSANELLTKHLKIQPPSIEAINKNVTTDFAQLLMRMMAKDPARRLDSMQALLDELGSTPIFRRRPPPPEDEGDKEDRR